MTTPARQEITIAVIIDFFESKNSLAIRYAGKRISVEYKTLNILIVLKIRIVSLKIYAGDIRIGYNGGY